MKAFGIVRNIDDFGRIVIPRELRRRMNIEVQDPIEFFVDDDGLVVLRKYKPTCDFCNSLDNIILYNDKRICEECIRKLAIKIDTSNLSIKNKEGFTNEKILHQY